MEIIRESPPPILEEYGIEFFEEIKPVGITAHLHIHPAMEFIYIKQGLFHIEVEKKSLSAHPGDLVLLHSNAVHMIENTGAGVGTYYVLKISPGLILEMFQKNSIPYIHPFFNSRSGDVCILSHADHSPRLKELWDIMIAEYEAAEPTFFAMQRLLACEFLLTCARLLIQPPKATDPPVPAVSERWVRVISESIDHINEQVASPLTAADCASRAHLSYNHYAKLFRAVTGKTFKEYLIDLRMARAYNMVLFSTLPVYEIAAACGYDNFSYFIAEFKKKYGLPPGRFRKKNVSEGDRL